MMFIATQLPWGQQKPSCLVELMYEVALSSMRFYTSQGILCEVTQSTDAVSVYLLQCNRTFEVFLHCPP